VHGEALWYGATDEEVVFLHRVSNQLYGPGKQLFFVIFGN